MDEWPIQEGIGDYHVPQLLHAGDWDTERQWGERVGTDLEFSSDILSGFYLKKIIRRQSLQTFS